MLGKFKTFFKKKETITASELEFDAPKPSSNPNFLTDPKKILDLLKDIEADSPLCTIVFEGKDDQYSSSILDVQIENNQLILDELLPASGNKLLISENKLKLSTIHKGIRLAFKLEGIKIGSSRGIAYYKAAIPDRIYYPQRRLTPRIQITTFNIPFSGISARTNTSIGASVFDLSRTGLAITIPNNIARLQRGDSIKNCHITIDKHDISFDLAVRFVKTANQSTGKTLIGGYFENTSSKSRNKLERFVTTIEREEIRNRKE